MPEYISRAILINFSSEDSEKLQKEGFKFFVAKPSKGETPNVAWITGTPSERDIGIIWEIPYYHQIYTSIQPPNPGNHLIKAGGGQSELGRKLIFNQAFIDKGPLYGVDGLSINNQFTSELSMTFGLAHDIYLNDQKYKGNITTAVSLRPNESVVLIPTNTVYIGVQKDVKPNEVSTFTGPLSKFDLSNQQNIKVLFDSKSGKFFSQ